MAVTLAYHPQGGGGLQVTCSHRQDHVCSRLRCLSPSDTHWFPWGTFWAPRVPRSGGPALGSKAQARAPPPKALFMAALGPGHPTLYLRETRHGPSPSPALVHTARLSQVGLRWLTKPLTLIETGSYWRNVGLFTVHTDCRPPCLDEAQKQRHILPLRVDVKVDTAGQ